VELGPRGRAARRQHGRAVEARIQRLALAQRARQSVRGLELLVQLLLLRLPGEPFRESAKGGRATGQRLEPVAPLPARMHAAHACHNQPCSAPPRMRRPGQRASGAGWPPDLATRCASPDRSLPCTDSDTRLLADKPTHMCATHFALLVCKALSHRAPPHQHARSAPAERAPYGDAKRA